MKIFADYHTHTTFSHGTGTPEDNVKAALKKGLRELAITDHGPGHLAYGIRNLDAYLNEIERLKKEYAGKIRIYSGVELNILDLKGRIDLPSDYVSAFDKKLLGYHKFIGIRGPRALWHFAVGKRYNVARSTQACIAALEKNEIDILTHPGYGMAVDLVAVAQACASTNTAFEINRSHGDLTIDQLSGIKNAGCSFVISSDAHCPEDVGFFGDAEKKAKLAGIHNIINAAEEEDEA